MFKKYIKLMLEAKTKDDIIEILYSAEGVDLAYQRDKINWNDHELLFQLAEKIINGLL